MNDQNSAQQQYPSNDRPIEHDDAGNLIIGLAAGAAVLGVEVLAGAVAATALAIGSHLVVEQGVESLLTIVEHATDSPGAPSPQVGDAPHALPLDPSASPHADTSVDQSTATHAGGNQTHDASVNATAHQIDTTGNDGGTP